MKVTIYLMYFQEKSKEYILYINKVLKSMATKVILASGKKNLQDMLNVELHVQHRNF